MPLIPDKDPPWSPSRKSPRAPDAGALTTANRPSSAGSSSSSSPPRRRQGGHEPSTIAPGNGESKRGDMIIDRADFPDQSGEQVLIQGKGSMKADDPRVTAAVSDVVTRLEERRTSPTSRARSAPRTARTRSRGTAARSS